MYIIKGCARCRGDLCLDEDGDLGCLQCGRTTSRAEHQQRAARTALLQAQPLVAAFAPKARPLGTSYDAA